MPAITLQQVEEDPERNDIFGILNEFIQPESSTSASQAAISFTKTVKPPQDEDFFWNFWKEQMFNVAEQIPHDSPAQDKLVLFLRELMLVPETGDKVWEVSISSNRCSEKKIHRQQHANAPIHRPASGQTCPSSARR
jgi:hypothetical protein